MSQAIPVMVAPAKSGAPTIFAKIKNGNVYTLNAKVHPKAMAGLIAKIKSAGKINLKHWTKYEPRPAKQEPRSEAYRLQYLKVWEDRCREAYERDNNKKLEGMVARKEAKLKTLNGDANGLRQIIEKEYEIALEYLRDACEQREVA